MTTSLDCSHHRHSQPPLSPLLPPREDYILGIVIVYTYTLVLRSASQHARSSDRPSVCLPNTSRTQGRAPKRFARVAEVGGGWGALAEQLQHIAKEIIFYEVQA